MALLGTNHATGANLASLDGVYQIQQLPPGPHRVSVNASGARIERNRLRADVDVVLTPAEETRATIVYETPSRRLSRR